jgi:hypothetical protein
MNKNINASQTKVSIEQPTKRRRTVFEFIKRYQFKIGFAVK